LILIFIIICYSQINIGAKDRHGCIPSAGYSWCHKLGKCVKPWELAKSIGMKFSLSSEFDVYCRNEDFDSYLNSHDNFD